MPHAATSFAWLLALLLIAADAAAQSNALTIWSRRLAPQSDHAYPVGNGRLGAMVFGTVERERTQLNEDTLTFR